MPKATKTDGSIKMKILESKFVKALSKMADGPVYQQGWHRENGGNLSYRLKPEEVEMIKPRLEYQENGRDQVEVPNHQREFPCDGKR